MTEQSPMKVITATKINGYFITAEWGPRAETPDDLAVRFFHMIDALKQIDPILFHWIANKAAI